MIDKRNIKIGLTVMILVIAIAANLSQILQVFNIYPNHYNHILSANLESDLLNYSDNTFKTAYVNAFGVELLQDLALNENNCSKNYPDYSLERLRCLMIIGQFYYGAIMYNDALRCFLKAEEVDARIADPYLSIGNIYYDLALLDLIKEKRFAIDEENLSFTLNPNEHTKALFEKAQEEYSKGETLKPLMEIAPTLASMGNTTIVLIDWPLINHRKKQMENVFSGSSSFYAAYDELVMLPLMVSYIYKDDNKLCEEMDKFRKEVQLKLGNANIIKDSELDFIK